MGYKILLENGTSNRRGTLLLKIEYKILHCYDDKQGRRWLLALEHKDQKFLIVNIYNENIEKKQVLTSVSSDHSPILVTFNSSSENTKGSAYWKFNSLLLKDPAF